MLLMNNSGMLYVYSGPSGVGKGSILGPYLQENTKAVLSVSVTTRAPRPGEQDGVEYHFISTEAFENLIEDDGLLEYARYSGNYYGTPRKQVQQALEKGLDVILEIEVKGAMQVKKHFPQAVFIFVLPPSFEVLEARLLSRGTEPPADRKARLEAACEEIRSAGQYDYIIVNDDLLQARKKLDAIIVASKCQQKYMKDYLDGSCESI